MLDETYKKENIEIKNVSNYEHHKIVTFYNKENTCTYHFIFNKNDRLMMAPESVTILGVSQPFIDKYKEHCECPQ